ncbi:hypothetical protein HYALB_00013223 [Hymenoscyphus albidus]|uniref:Ankyrin n=1 Tax=Hymenoscyphus albidus TaxID=595503 RepID=A0A9N9LQD5_9HELO|nr:hypothetical protein HYALB_00013223 [Hymenoscyphus albidus]
MERFILSSSKGLAGVTKSKNKTVQSIHESVRDYLLRGKGFETLRAGLKNIPGQSHDALKDCCLMYLEFDKSDYIPEKLPLASTEEAASLRQIVYQTFPFLHYVTENIFYHADCSHGNGVEQLGFLDDLLAIGGSDMHLPNTHCSTPVLAVPRLKYHIKAWILTRNLLEKFQIRRYTPDGSLLYIFAERDLSNLLRLELARVPHMDIKGERYGFPVHAAIANSCDLALRTFLAAGSSLFTESEHEEAVQCVRENRREITSQSTETLLSWALKNRKLPLIKIFHRSEKVDNSSIKTSMKDFLLNATYHGKSDWVKLVSSADLFASDPLLIQSALCSAAAQGHEEVAKLIIQYGKAIVNSTNEYVKGPLWHAATSGHAGILRLLLEYTIDSSVTRGFLPLLEAAHKGHTELVKILLQTGKFDINCSDDFGRTPFLLAVSMGHMEVVKMLIEIEECDINRRDIEFNTPLSEAISKGCLEIVKLLIATGRHAAVVKLLLDTDKCFVNIKDPTGDTPLSLAARSNQVDVVRLLLQIPGCDINSKNIAGNTPLSLAAREGAVEVLRVLLETGQCDIDSKNCMGETPLLLAIRLQCPTAVDILKMFLATDKCDLNSMETVEKWNSEAVQILFDTGRCDLNFLDRKRDTPLLAAANQCCTEIAGMILKSGGADLARTNIYGQTAREIASGYGNTGLFEIIDEYSHGSGMVIDWDEPLSEPEQP